MATTATDDFVDDQMEVDEIFPCQACGEILEEGKAYELSGKRWHLNCFRCHTCGTLLDSDNNLLLLGDGSLICNNCTYSCVACGNKIEDLAILTGNEAFCATCFRCRNCKRKIENLRYAKTSQGIFCMTCHGSIMVRRRKKSKAAQQAKSREKDGSASSAAAITDKSLPALPPSAVPSSSFSPIDHGSPGSDTATELSPQPRTGTRAAYPENSSRSSSQQARSPDRSDGRSYRNNRKSSIVNTSTDSTAGLASLDADSFLVPVALDPTPAPTLGTPGRTSFPHDARGSDADKEKDYFSLGRVAPEKPATTPHIAFQGRQTDFSYEDDHALPVPLPKTPRASDSAEAKLTKPSTAAEDARSSLQRRNTSTLLLDETSSPARKNSLSFAQRQLTMDDDGSRSSTDTTGPPPRFDSQLIAGRKDLPNAAVAARNATGKAIAPQKLPVEDAAAHASRPRPPESKLTDTYMQPRPAPAPPTGAHPAHEAQPSTGGAGGGAGGGGPPSPKISPKLPRWSAGGDFSMDEDMARILGTDEGSSSILRRVSNAVRHGRVASTDSATTSLRLSHGRSQSDAARGLGSPRWPKPPGREGVDQDVNSPISLSGEDGPFLKRQLRNSDHRVADIERQHRSENELKSINQKLAEKRKTVSELDTQTELLVQQLEVLSGLVEKQSSESKADVKEIQEAAIKEFMQRLDALRLKFYADLEQIAAARDEMEEQRNQAMAERDRALVEFEQLSTKNAQLADLNNDLTHQIQERFKNHMGTPDIRSPGAQTPAAAIHQVPRGVSLMSDTSMQTSGTGLSHDPEDAIIEPGVPAVKIGRGQVKKFNWKKGTSKTMQTVAKNVKGAVGAAFQNQQHGPGMGASGASGSGSVGGGGGGGGGGVGGGIDSQSLGVPYEATRVQLDAAVTHHVPTPPNGGLPGSSGARQPPEQARQGFGGFFRQKNATTYTSAPSPVSKASMASAASLSTPALDASTLFGSDLSERAEYERRQIPCVVTRCIEEVELRGMDVVGIYRKTGGNSQVKMVQDGFDKHEDFDISDPSIDITAVTSVLKQYFRKLPIPLLTFEVYDRILESATIPNEETRIDHLKMTFGMLPEKHRDCLKFLMFHLARVAQRERENLMSPKNLAVVFAPTIMRDRSIEREVFDMHAKNSAVQFVIEHSERIFDS